MHARCDWDDEWGVYNDTAECNVADHVKVIVIGRL